ncbi:MAG: UDP-N-acetylmuramoyl-L-alanine--D-glutamate ligase [Bacteroidota bacterium]
MKSNRIVILGGGESGVGAAILAKQKGFDVFVSDKGLIKDYYKSTLTSYNLIFEEGKHTSDLILNANEVIKSPGIPDKSVIIQEIKEQGIPIISEIEFASRFTNAKKICITGSNGKTTTSSLTYHILKNAGFNVGLAGNIGKSFALQVAEEKYDYYVLELSSFQLDNMYQFKADIAVLMNISANHLDRYDNKMESYINSKFRIINNQSESDVFIYSADDDIIEKELKARKISATKYSFSIKKTLHQGAWLSDNQMLININENIFNMSIFELALQGKHNIYNSMAASIVGRILDLRNEDIRQSLSDFQGIEHRLEYVTSVHGIEFINDSKSTTVNSTWWALESMNKPVILILGGVDKGNDYSMLNEMVKEKVKAIICLGVDNKKILKAFKNTCPEIYETLTADDAVKISYKIGKKGDVVLLSPGCASFDLFENYEERGRKFKMAAKSL